MMNTQYKLLKTMEKCERNGEALESNMRKLWKKCPARDEILNMGAGGTLQHQITSGMAVLYLIKMRLSRTKSHNNAIRKNKQKHSGETVQIDKYILLWRVKDGLFDS